MKEIALLPQKARRLVPWNANAAMWPCTTWGTLSIGGLVSDVEMVPTDHLDDGEHPLPKSGGIVVTTNHLFAELWAPKQATPEGDRQKQEDVEEEAGELVLCTITTGMWGPKPVHSTHPGKWSYTTAIEEKNLEPTTAADGERGKIGG